MDENGYPDDDELEKIRNWPPDNNFEGLMDYVKRLWHWPEYFKQDGAKKYTLVTGGWSGNEDLIEALNSNYLFWILWWESSTRGGKHVFRRL